MGRGRKIRIPPRTSQIAGFVIVLTWKKNRKTQFLFHEVRFTCFSCKVSFPDAFKRQVDGTFVQVNEVEKLPGTQYTLQVKASPGTRLGLLSVDQSVYLMRNDNRLTKERVSTAAKY